MRTMLAAAAFLTIGCAPGVENPTDAGPVDAGPAQSPVCAAYMQCQADLDAEAGTNGFEQGELEYGEFGTCWDNEGRAAICENDCACAVGPMAYAYPDLTSCTSAAEQYASDCQDAGP